MNLRKLIPTFIIIFYLEIVYHLLVFKVFDIKSFLYLLIFTILQSIFIDLVTNLFNKRPNKIIYLIIVLFINILFLSQYINYKFYGNVISIYSIIHGGQVFGFFSAILSVIKENILGCALLALPIPLLLIFNKKIKFKYANNKYNLIKFGLLLIIFLVNILCLNFDKKEIYSAKNLYFYKHVPNNMAQTFGILTTMRLDLERTINNFEESVSIIKKEEKKPIEKEVEYNITDIDFNELANNETNNEIKNIHLYMANEEASEKNEYTGMFKGKNLIAIVAEAFSPIAVDENLTPTLYKLVNTGFNFTNFYTPIYYVSTSDGEYVTLNSLLPKESVWSFSKSSNNYLPYSYGNLFKNSGYNTYAFHDGTYKYYDRHKSHPNMGYTYTACGNGLEKSMHCKVWPQSDIEMIDATFDKYANDEHFMTYYMTISGHLEYNFFGNNMAYKNRQLVEDLNYSTAVKAYKATQIELDRALEKLLNKLEEKGILDDTVIVLSADHYPYGLTTNQIKEVETINDEKFDIHQNNLVIWSSTIKEPIKVNKISESLDILPTVLNLFGFDYDSRLLIGSDILSPTDGLVILNDRSWITEYGKYDAATKKFTLNEGMTVSDDYVEKINTIVYNKYVISKNILDTNYYKYIFKGE